MLKLARSPAGRFLVGLVFGHMSFLLPVQRLRETRSLVAFYHPKPSYALHVLIVPKKVIPSLVDIRLEDQDFLADLFQCVRSLVEELGLAQTGYRLIANGGSYQDIPQLHFHLVSGESLE